MRAVSSEFSRTVALACHASSIAGGVHDLQVHVGQAHIGTARSGMLDLRYLLTADMSRVRVATRVTPRRADELWTHTCFEAFVKWSAAVAYVEVNLAPSTEWAIYSFQGYREGMTPVETIPPPRIEVRTDTERFELEATIDLSALRPPPRDSASNTRVQLALAAVIEDENGRLSYWALGHPQGKPDFHHPDSFTLEL